MNAPIIDPLQGAFPEVIEEYLEHGVMKCIAFNRRGTLLAAGCSDGSCVIWDFETRGIAKVFRDSESVAAITSICWSKNGHRILVAAADRSLKLWDVLQGEKVARIILPQVLLHARLHPGSSIPHICLVCPLSSTPMLVDLQTSVTTPLPVYLPEKDNGTAPSRNKSTEGPVPFTPTAACFNKTGDLIYAGNPKGEILIIDCKTIQILAIVPIPGNAVIKNIVFSRNGQCLLTNSSDRIIRIYQSLLPSKDGANAISDLSSKVSDQDEVERLKTVGSGCLSLIREFQDLVTKVLWKAPCFSGDGKWVIGGSANKGEHKIYIWDMETGHLVKILEGPKEALIDLAWHPTHPVVVSVSLTGLAYIWAKDYTENWSAFAPDFKELEENEEYVEREDEFDLVPETEKENDSGVNEDEDVDILTVDKDSDFSDSDTSHDEVRYLPAEPSADAPEPKDQLILNPLKIENGSRSVSPLSEEAELNGHLANHDLSPMEDDAGGPPPSKRKRKPSEKVNGYA